MSYHCYVTGPMSGSDGMVEGKFCCPCCGFPTLDTWSAFEICVLCSWEDDGTDDASADHFLGGPNGSYLLTEARRNFEDHGDMYRYDETRITVVSEPSPERLALLDYVRSLESGTRLDGEIFFRLLRTADGLSE